jgi:SulP family sulfate permease
MHHVNHCDFSGIHMLENVVRFFRDQGGDVFIVRVSQPVLALMRSTGCDRFLGADHFLAEDEAIAYIFHHILDPAVCIYECSVRAFKECQNLPKRIDLINIPLYSEVPKANILAISPQKLWLQLHNGYGGKPPFVVDVREPREFRQGHIPEAQLIPLPTIMSDSVKLPNDRPIILVCRTGRRSRRAAYALQHIGCVNVAVLQGGMQAWEAAGLLAAVE